MKKLKRNRKLYSKNEELKEKKRQYYQENKERIREKNAKFSKYCLYSHKKKNEEEIEELSIKEEDLNILYRNTVNLEEILQDEFVMCEHCKDAYKANTIFKHIGFKKECKAFYGTDLKGF